MECFLCLELKQDKVDCIGMNSTTWDELQVQTIIEKHLWATIMFKPKSKWLCLTCWRILQEFHNFYTRVENEHISHEYIIKNECDSLSDVEFNDPKSVELVEPENALDQESITFVKEEIEVHDNECNDDIPLIHMRKSFNTSLGDPLNDSGNSITECTITSDINNAHEAEIIIPCSDNQQDNEDVDHTVKSEQNGLQLSKDNKSKSSLKYFYQSKLSCRDYDKFLAKHFKLICSNCEQPFDTFSQLKSHFREIHNQRGYVLCCETEFYNRGLFVDHINCHLNPKYFKCEFCPKVFKVRKTFKAHMGTHERNPHNCDICNKKFGRKCYLEYHKQTHVLSEHKKIPCKKCDKLFASKYLLSKHQKLVHLEKRCETCGESLPNSVALRNHMKKHKGTISCDTCGLLVKSKQNLKIHMKAKHSEEGNQGHVCHICQKVSLTANGLSHHIRRNHQIGNNHKCTVCEKSFKRLDHLKSHLNIHADDPDLFKSSEQTRVLTEDKQIPCKECDKIFASEYLMSKHLKLVHQSKKCDICGHLSPSLRSLKRHKQKHDGDVSCDTCGLLVSSKYNLQIHKKLIHPVEGPQEHICHICQRVSLTANALSHHIRRNHRTGYIHKCTVCEKTFKRLDHLKAHMDIHTGIDSYKCSWCPRTCKTHASLNHHRKAFHPKEWEESRRKKYSGYLPPNTLTRTTTGDNEN